MKKTKKLLLLMTAFVLFVGIGFVDLKANEPEGTPMLENVVLKAMPRSWQGHHIVLYLENNTGENLYISGGIQIYAGGGWQDLERGYDIFSYGEEDELVIAPGATEELVQVAPGNPMSWRLMYSNEHALVNDMVLKLNYRSEGMLDPEPAITNSASTNIINEIVTLVGEPWEHIYFPGDTFAFSMSNLPVDVDGDGYIVGEGDKFSSGRIYFYFMDPANEEAGFVSADFFEGLLSDEKGFYKEIELVNGTFDMELTISDEVAFSHVSYHIQLDDDIEDMFDFRHTKPYGLIDWRNDYNTVFVWVVPEAPEEIAGIKLPNMRQIENLYETEKEIEFTMPGTGSITFGPGLNLFENSHELELLSTAMNISFNSETRQLNAKVETEVVTFLRDKGAVIRFYNAMESLGLTDVTQETLLDYISVSVIDGGNLVDDLSDYLNIEAITYDAETDVLSIPVNHFTEYVVSLASTDPIVETGSTNNLPYLIIGLAILTFGTKKYLKRA